MRSFRSTLLGCLALGVAGVPMGPAYAQDRDHGWSRWKSGEVVQSNQPAKYGATCKTEFTSRGSGPVGFGITQFWAKRHTIRNWEDAAVKLYGAEFAKWRRARAKSVACERAGNEWNCKATATPCT